MSLTMEILEILKGLGEVGIDAMTGNFRSIHSMGMPRNYYTATDRMVKRGLLKKRKTGRKVTFRITAKGRELLQSPMKLNRRKDGMSTLVLFDIPEDRHNDRDRLRRFLRRHKFTSLQKSVMIGPFEISKDFRILIDDLKLTENVKTLSVKIDL